MKKPKFWWALIVLLGRVVVVGDVSPKQPGPRHRLQRSGGTGQSGRHLHQYRRSKARALQKEKPDPHRQFSDLMTAIGTNDIRGYFPDVDVRNEEHPTYAILNLLQRKAAGKIKLGLDLQGGTEFLVSLNTNQRPGRQHQRQQVRRGRGRRAAAPGFRRRWRSCAAAWTAWAWPSRSSSRKAKTTS